MSTDEMMIDSAPAVANGAAAAAADDSDAMDVETTTKPQRLPVTVSKPIPYTFDLGNLLCNDENPLPPAHAVSESDIQAAARDCAQALLNQLLSTCAISRTDDGTSMTLALPAPATALPREKPVPADKPPTKWQEFAKKKGIKDKKKDTKLVFDEASGEWVPKWGYKGKNKQGENDWLVEVDAKKEKATGEVADKRQESREQRKKNIRLNERQQKKNAAKMAGRTARS
ncbi:hypothetical protein MBLNU459_g3786t1 [Dothideomycetes sp. NU459]